MGVSASAISRVTGVEVSYKNFNAGNAALLPQRLAIVGPGNSGVAYSTKKYECESSAALVAERYGYGSPLHLACLQLFPQSGNGASFPVTIYPVAEGASAVAAAGSLGATGTATANGSGKIYIGGIVAEFAVTKDDTNDTILGAIKTAIDGVLNMPVTAGEVTDHTIALTSKCKGTIGNLIKIELDAAIAGITFTVTQLSDGSIDGDVDSALAAIGNVWETVILDLYPYNNSTNLDKYQNFGEGRWGVLNKKGCLVAHGCTDNYATRTAVTDARPNDYINFLIESCGSRELPYVVAAKGLVNDIMTQADKDPACGYKGLLTGLHTGDDLNQEDYNVRNQAVSKGASTNIKEGSAARLNDIITFYHPVAEGKYPSRRYVVDMMKLMNIVYNVRLIMEADSMIGVPLVPDEDVVTNPNAVQPKMVVTAFVNLAKSLAKKALISDAEFTKKNLKVAIDSENPKRLNVQFPVKLSGNIEVSSTDVYFGFYLGGE